MSTLYIRILLTFLPCTVLNGNIGNLVHAYALLVLKVDVKFISQMCTEHYNVGTRYKRIPVKNVTLYISSCLFAFSLIENETKSDGNPIIFFANALELP